MITQTNIESSTSYVETEPGQSTAKDQLIIHDDWLK